MQEVLTHERILCAKLGRLKGFIRLLRIFRLFVIFIIILKFLIQTKFQWAVTRHIVNECHGERLLEWSGEQDILILLNWHPLCFLAEELGYIVALCDPVQNSISFGQNVQTDCLCGILTQISLLCNDMSIVL